MFNCQIHPKVSRCLLALLLLSLTVMGSLATAPPVQAADYVPLKGRFAGAGANFAGNFSHLGKVQGVVDATTFTALWTAANGDTVTNQTTSFVVGEEVTPDVHRYEQSIVITGGTGRFANATGSATVTGLINVATGAYDGKLIGTISRPNRG